MPFPRLTRRRFFTGLGAAAVGAYLYAWRIEPHWVEVVERTLPLENLPAILIGKKLVQISDLHIGDLVDDDYISSQIRRACSLGDLLVITGDFMSSQAEEQIEHVARVLESSLHHPPLGVFAVLGNHDYGHSFRNHYVADQLHDRLRDAGIQVLRNEVADVNGLQLGGVDELWGGLFNLRKTLFSIDQQKASLMLCHNPDGADAPGWDGYRGWILCGHTHGGQCKSPFLDPPMLPVKNRRYTAGEINIGDGRKLYINRALGHLQRVRFNVRPEITVFTLASV